MSWRVFSSIGRPTRLEWALTLEHRNRGRNSWAKSLLSFAEAKRITSSASYSISMQDLSAMTLVSDAGAGPGTAEIVLSARRISKAFGGFIAVKDLDLDIRRGGIHALIGPNGAGKTTVFNLLTSFLAPTAGRIFFHGADITGMAPELVARRGLVRSFQISATFQHMTVAQNIRVALQRPFVSPWTFWTRGAPPEEIERRIIELLAMMDLGSFADRRAGDLPYGRKRTLELAATLAADPTVILLDEPTQGLGIEDVDRVADLIKNIARERTVLMVEHNMSMVSRIADRITVLRAGSIIADGEYAEVSKNPEVIEAYLGSGQRARKH
jgi:branched-chain amino acid transport system ATP-binding protein